tara:strand:+ start:374 stop:817 length:444 start_codon:yes stop_codon:yes gene_type:complete
VEKMNKEEVIQINEQEIHDDYGSYDQKHELCAHSIHENTNKYMKGVNKMAKTIAQTSTIQNVSDYPSNGSNYKGVNKMAKQMALATDTKTKTENVFANENSAESAQIQRLTVDMPSDLHKEFKVWCVMHNLKMNELIRDLIRETIKA